MAQWSNPHFTTAGIPYGCLHEVNEETEHYSYFVDTQFFDMYVLTCIFHVLHLVIMWFHVVHVYISNETVLYFLVLQMFGTMCIDQCSCEANI